MITMKKILLLITIAYCATLFISCEGLLDKYPRSQMSPETFFSNENELQAYSNQFYKIFPATSIYTENIDNVTKSEVPPQMRDGRVIPNSGGGWSWSALRDVNTLLQYSENCKDVDVRNKYDALARFFRTYFYFEKIKRFGDVPWYSTPLDSDDPELKRPRDSREYVMQQMIADIDYAIKYLTGDRSLYRVTKWTALALKSRFCLFEGTFRKYHKIEGFDHDWKWYLEQSAEASETFITSSGYSLYSTSDPQTSYRDLFASENAQIDEIILARDYNGALNVFHNANFYTMSQSSGRPGMTRKFVDSYLMADGSRFTDQKGWQTMEFVCQCIDRDPRLAQSIRTPGYKRLGSSTAEAPDLAVTVSGYQLVKFVTNSKQDEYDKSFNDLPIFRMAEVYLNYAEAKAELEVITQADINMSITKLRKRVDMPDLTLSTANANPDPYLSDSKTGYPNVTGPNKGVILEIRRERSVELMQEGFRYYDVMRWKEGKTFEQPLLGLYIPKKGEYDIDGDGKADVYFATKGETPVTSAKLKLVIDQDIFLSEGDHGFISPHKNLQGIWNEERDYFYPIPTDDRSLTNGALTQNPGWNDGLIF